MVILIVNLVLLVLYLISCFLIYLFISSKNFSFAFKGFDKKFEEDLKEYADLVKYGSVWMKKQDIEEVSIKSKDGFKLMGKFISNDKFKNSKIIILSHGYRSNAKTDIYPSCHEYYDMGCSLLIVDSRACGDSEGKIITFGYKEHEDLSLWVDYIHKRFKKSKIILAGISMGASTSLMVPNINKHVDGVIADSGYRNAYKEVSYVLNYFFRVPSKIFMPMVNVFCILFGKFNLKWIDTVNSLKNKNVPILFIHGIDDEFVLIDNTIDNYNNYKGKKDKLFVNYASHGLGYFFDKKSYVSKVKNFLKNI